MTLVLREHEMCNLGRCNFKENKKEYALTTNIQLPYKYLCHQTLCSVINFECLNFDNPGRYYFGSRFFCCCW